MKRLNVNVEDELYKQFKLKCLEKDREMSEVVLAFIARYVQEKSTVESAAPAELKVEPQPTPSRVESTPKLSWMVEDKMPAIVKEEMEVEEARERAWDFGNKSSGSGDDWFEKLFDKQ